MTELRSTERVTSLQNSNASRGRVYWNPVKFLWLTAMTVIGLVGGVLTFSWDALLVFVVLTAMTICGGHSVGMHRLLIHRSFKVAKWVEYILVYLGVLVGMAGPFGMIRLHDFRDWGQRQLRCHDFFSHSAGFWKDAWWQLHCSIRLEQEPEFRIETPVFNDPVYRAIEKSWMWQQLPLGILLYALGGAAWVVWGVCVRVSVSLIGHWLVGYFAHQPMEQTLHVRDTAVQGQNLPGLGLITFGEAFHENHHAFPSSAKLGLFKNQIDPGWWLIVVLEFLGLANEIKTPETLDPRDGLVRNQSATESMPDWFAKLPPADGYLHRAG